MAEEKTTGALFLQFVSTLYSSAMWQLGKVMNPITGKIEKDINAANATIELMSMLKEKTKGNLDKAELSAIDSALSNMQMNYVDEVKREGESKEKSDKKSGES